MRPTGLVLAAGQGRRYGGPKAFVRTDEGETWLERTAARLHEAGCEHVVATLPAGESVDLPGVTGIALPARDLGQAASLELGLGALADRGAELAVVMLVDLPDVDARVIRRVLEHTPDEPGALARASYAGRPGHPVVMGRDHFAPLRAGLHGDTGARLYVAGRGPVLVECGDLATGEDRDRPDR